MSKPPYIITGGRARPAPAGAATPYSSPAFEGHFRPSPADAPADLTLRLITDTNFQQLALHVFLSGPLNLAPRDDLPEMDAARKQVKETIERTLRGAAEVARRQGLGATPWPREFGDHRPAEVLYAAMRCFAGKIEYAALAERETSNFIGRLIADGGGSFYDITARSAKSVYEHGPDGLFVGAARIFGLAREYTGLEVKTIVSTKSLRSVLSTLKQQVTDDPLDFRLKTISNARERLDKIADVPTNLRAAIAKLKPAQVATMLVVRECGLSAVRPDPWVYQTFDLLLFFDAYNRIRWDLSRGVRSRQLQKWIDEKNQLWLHDRAVEFLRNSVFRDARAPVLNW